MSYIRTPIYVYWSGAGIFCYDDTGTLHEEHEFYPTEKGEKEANLIAYTHMLEHVIAFTERGRSDEANTVFLAIIEDIEWRADDGMKKAIEDALEDGK
jgi:hypothetical protein